jgi:hypothetical protein
MPQSYAEGNLYQAAVDAAAKRETPHELWTQQKAERPGLYGPAPLSPENETKKTIVYDNKGYKETTQYGDPSGQTTTVVVNKPMHQVAEEIDQAKQQGQFPQGGVAQQPQGITSDPYQGARPVSQTEQAVSLDNWSPEKKAELWAALQQGRKFFQDPHTREFIPTELYQDHWKDLRDQNPWDPNTLAKQQAQFTPTAVGQPRYDTTDPNAIAAMLGRREEGAAAEQDTGRAGFDEDFIAPNQLQWVGPAQLLDTRPFTDFVNAWWPGTNMKDVDPKTEFFNNLLTSARIKKSLAPGDEQSKKEFEAKKEAISYAKKQMEVNQKYYDSYTKAISRGDTLSAQNTKYLHQKQVQVSKAMLKIMELNSNIERDIASGKLEQNKQLAGFYLEQLKAQNDIVEVTAQGIKDAQITQLTGNIKTSEQIRGFMNDAQKDARRFKHEEKLLRMHGVMPGKLRQSDKIPSWKTAASFSKQVSNELEQAVSKSIQLRSLYRTRKVDPNRAWAAVNSKLKERGLSLVGPNERDVPQAVTLVNDIMLEWEKLVKDDRDFAKLPLDKVVEYYFKKLEKRNISPSAMYPSLFSDESATPPQQ